MPQKWLQFDKDTSICEFTKHVLQYDLQKKQEASAIIGNAIVHAVSPPTWQTLVGYCRAAEEVSHD